MHLSDLGGEENTSAAEQSLCRRAAALTIALEMLEVRLASEGELPPTIMDSYSRYTNTLRRTLEAIGLQRRAKDATPTVAEYVASIQDEANA